MVSKNHRASAPAPHASHASHHHAPEHASETHECAIPTDSDTHPQGSQIEVFLWAAKIPFLGAIADHHWFVIDRQGIQSRWEVWQKPNACSNSWGHLNLNLLPPTCGVGNGDAVLHRQWSGSAAQTLATRIEQSPQQYPWCNTYWYWPGPNSNTYVQWVLLGEHKLGHRALGKQFCSIFTRT